MLIELQTQVRSVVRRLGLVPLLDRFRAVLKLVDMIRLDHFRGFEAYWEVPATESTAVNGRWVKGPGSALFEAARLALVDQGVRDVAPDVRVSCTPYPVDCHQGTSVITVSVHSRVVLPLMPSKPQRWLKL